MPIPITFEDLRDPDPTDAMLEAYKNSMLPQRDKTAQANVWARLLQLPKLKPPAELFKMPRYSTNIIAPILGRASLNEAIEAGKDKYNDVKYMNPIPYEGLVNEAVNRHLSKVKK